MSRWAPYSYSEAGAHEMGRKRFQSREEAMKAYGCRLRSQNPKDEFLTAPLR